jgi:D-3-phosphoglycerate dehydrogenase
MEKILLSEPIPDVALELLRGKADIVVACGFSEKAVLEDITDTYGIVLRSKTKITRKIIEAAPRLRIISRTGTGYDNVDVEAASEHNVMVCNLPGVNAVSVAEHAMAFILALSKKLADMDGFVRNGAWNKRSDYISIELEGKTLGIIGLGQIGYKVMKMAQAFGMNTLAWDPFVEGLYTGHTSFSSSLEELFRVSDFITIHVPNLTENRHMVSEELLLLMKKGAFLINTSRGEVVNEKALVKVLEQNRIGGAALDVFETEPLTMEHPFTRMKNVILSPHAAALTVESGTKLAVKAVEQVVGCLEGRIPPHIVNRDRIKL